MAAAGVGRQELGDVDGLGLFGAAADGEFRAVVQHAVGDADVHFVHFHQGVADHAQDIGVAALGLGDGKMVFSAVVICCQRLDGNLQILEGQIGILQQDDGVLIDVGFQLVAHGLVHGVIDFVHFVGVHVQAVVEGGGQLAVGAEIKACLREHVPDDGGAGAVAVADFPEGRQVFRL